MAHRPSITPTGKTPPVTSRLLLLRLLLVLHPPLRDPLQNALPVLIQLQLRDDDFRGVDAQRHRLTVGFLAGDALDVDDIFETVDGGDFALAAFVGAADDGDFVVFADGHRADLYREGGTFRPCSSWRSCEWQIHG